MRVSFYQRSVHICARVALVGITNQVFLVVGIAAYFFPFFACGISAAAASTQAAAHKDVANLFGRIVKDGFHKGFVAVACQVLVEAGRRYLATIIKQDAFLIFKKRQVVYNGQVVIIFMTFVAYLSQHMAARELVVEALVEQAYNVGSVNFLKAYTCFSGHLKIHERLGAAQSKASNLCHLGVNSVVGQVFFNGREGLFGSGGNPAGSHPDINYGFAQVVVQQQLTALKHFITVLVGKVEYQIVDQKAGVGSSVFHYFSS